MTDHNLEINETATPLDQAGASSAVNEQWKTYEVQSVNGFMFNGKLYKQGDLIELPKATADNYKTTKDIKNAK